MRPRRPPFVARALLRLFLPGAIHESFAGDLEERFHGLAESDPEAARRGYWGGRVVPHGAALPPRGARHAPTPNVHPPARGEEMVS